jgi:L-lactate dehydrogenase (cytochrome)
MVRADRIFCVADARVQARRRMPRMMFDYVDGAAGNESASRLNCQVLDAIRLLPRVLVNVEERSLTKSFLDREWGLPFGIAPMGMCNLTWPGADAILAQAAVRHDIPLCLSTAASSTIEQTRTRAGDNAWFQLYVGHSNEVSMDLVRRADEAGYEVLMLTVDVPQVSQRLRDLKNGFQIPFRIGTRQFLDFARHPAWSLGTLAAGVPVTANFTDYAASESSDKVFKAWIRNEGRGRIDWQFLEMLRERWPRTLMVKGVLAPADAVAVKERGVDALYVSNHGGRQLDSAPAAIHMLPLIRRAVGEGYPIIFDSGVRNGEGIVKALALGADFVMLGRAFLYAIGADGERGLEKIIKVLGEEISLAMAQIGRRDLIAIDGSLIYEHEIEE